MARTFSAPEFVTLPRLSAGAALTLGTELLTVANKHRALPAPLAKAKKRLEASLEELRETRRARREVEEIDASAAVAADQVLDAAWSALYSFLQGWSKLPGKGAKLAPHAKRLLEAVFPQGLKFTQLAYKLEWAESQTRLDRLGEKENAASLRELGGELFVTVLREAHRDYGLALHITQAKEVAAEAAKVREPLDAFADALRRYALRVTAHADDDDDEQAAELAATLLAPLASWRSSERRAGRGDVGEEPPPAGPDVVSSD